MTALKSFTTGAAAIAVAFIPLYLAVVLAGPVPMAAGAQDEHGRWWSDGCRIGVETSGTDLRYKVAIGGDEAEGTLPKPGSLTWDTPDRVSWSLWLAKPGHDLKLRDSGVGDCPPDSTTTTTLPPDCPPGTDDDCLPPTTTTEPPPLSTTSSTTTTTPPDGEASTTTTEAPDDPEVVDDVTGDDTIPPTTTTIPEGYHDGGAVTPDGETVIFPDEEGG